jgi:predicted nucleic acid-binding protein
LRFLLDTDVTSQSSKATANAEVARWWQAQDAADLWLSVIVLQELRYGIEMLPQGKRRRELEVWLDRVVAPAFKGRILPVDEAVADLAGRMLAASRQAGPIAGTADVLIAATARVHGMKVATLNRKHFERLGVELVTF